ncbi:siphovirus Gp157 family protein [Aedoeadaptatus coxii]|uniref:siphovirus Gp157 family protein n=1 Tax=Aedoeadaptatus coxii TaxID=755172 RepID=UPI002AD404E1|nr:siphovirus Gp157 family protein [Peptoniphilus coxii]
MKLYELTEIYENIENLDDDVNVASALATVDGELEDKLESIAKMIKNLNATAAAYEEEEKRLKAQKIAVKNRVDDIKRYVKENLEAIGKDKVEAGIFKWSLQFGPGRVEITDETKIPKEFFVTEVKPLKTEIKKAIENGVITEGAEIIREKSIRLR